MLTKLIERKEIAEGTTEITLECPDGFRFKPGQYVQIIIPGLIEGNRREFSIASSPNEKRYLLLAFRNSESAFKKKIRELPIGSTLEIEGPYGLFTLQQKEENIILVAGGIGITPFMSMAQFAAEEKLSYALTLVTINSSKERAPFKEEVTRLEKENPKMKVMNYIGKPSAEKFRKDIPKDVGKIYVAGPPGIVSEVKQTLIEVGVDEEKILVEDFIGYA